MSDFTIKDIITSGPSAAAVDIAESVHPEVVEPMPSTQQPPKRKPGRPKKDQAHNQNNPDSATQVSYVTKSVKSMLKRIQACQVINSGSADTESRIIESALQLYVKHNKLNIN